MRDPDRTRVSHPPLLALLILLCGLGGGLGCGREIGDECVIASDCSPNGDRQCLVDPNTKGGYCTVQGCDYSTCPEEAVCVRFFTGSFSNRQCNRLTEDDGTDDCSFDELCSLTADSCDFEPAAACGRCVPRSAEIRFCMRTCESDDDCRDEYECRDLERMKAHGGEPVLAPGVDVDERAPKFCAVAPG
jgi:hypothetical protein